MTEQAPPGASAMEIAFKIVGNYVNRVGAYDLAETEFQEYENDLAREIAHAIEQAEREARASLREQGYCMVCGVYHRVGECQAVENAVREAREDVVSGARIITDNIPVALEAARRAARAAALEEAATAMPENYQFSQYPDLQRSAQSACHVFRGYIRALAAKPEETGT